MQREAHVLLNEKEKKKNPAKPLYPFVCSEQAGSKDN